ncbi:hypothetical protein J5X84_21400 [Streptosporangiaceae bacterium NEAU-GS5]|nr:hypothetical protein [Streptosporangiaceae bacterium NEAU-GS5]
MFVWLIAAAAGLIGLTVVLVRRGVALVTISGSSMTPTYADGDRVVMVRSRRLRRGGVIVFRMPPPSKALPRGGALVIKRVAALPGDEVPASVWDASGAGPGDRVPPGHFVVFGDAPVGPDSRIWGLLPAHAVEGVVVGVRR